MLDKLRRIIQEVSTARNLDQALALIVQRVREAIDADVCSVYLTDFNTNELVLQATEGLHPESVGRVRLRMDEGLVGLAADRAEPVNLRNAPDHPRYRYFSETGEERYHAFLGVPIIHHRQVLGVLVVQQYADVRYDEDTVTVLVTIAAQLAGAIAHARAVGNIELGQHRELDGRPFLGLPGASGVALGTVAVVHPFADIDAIPDRPVEDVAAEQERFISAIEAVRNDIRGMIERVSESLPDGDSALFEAYLMMLDSDSLVGSTLDRIRQGNWAPGALRETVREHLRIFESMEDAYLRERAEDVRDLGRRVLHFLRNGANSGERVYPKRTVLVGEEITASMLAEVPPRRLKAVVSVRGSRTSHTAILARAMGIPAVMGVSELPVGSVDGKLAIADGYSGRVFINPSRQVQKEYRRLQREEAELTEDLQELVQLPAETTDGFRMPLYANTGLVSDIRPSLSSGAEGIGLYRTEFPFMVRERFPGEEEQYRVYRQVLEAFAPQPVTMRTLDVGGDKALPYFPIEEDNPFLGWRGIRIMLDHPEIFQVQLRAMLRASEGLDNLQLLLPMISSPSEVDEALKLIRRTHGELVAEGRPIAMPRVGAMIEVPSAVYQVVPIARRVDFLSVGTNDLTQYLLAVDRNNPQVAELYDSLHPAVIQALRQIVQGAHRNGCPVSVCGEMAGDPAATVLLVGMGIDSLSMSSSSLPRIKWVIRSFSQFKARQILHRVTRMEHAGAIREYLNQILESAGMGGLVRAGK